MGIATLIAPLSNISIAVPTPLNLSDNTEIHQIPLHVNPIIQSAWDSRFIRHPEMYHPDRTAGLAPEFRELAEQRMKVINAAYDQIKRTFKRLDNG